jgi:hypothetical protein
MRLIGANAARSIYFEDRRARSFEVMQRRTEPRFALFLELP